MNLPGTYTASRHTANWGTYLRTTSNLKRKPIDVCLLPVLTYGAETFMLIRTSAKKLNATKENGMNDVRDIAKRYYKKQRDSPNEVKRHTWNHRWMKKNPELEAKVKKNENLRKLPTRWTMFSKGSIQTGWQQYRSKKLKELENAYFRQWRKMAGDDDEMFYVHFELPYNWNK